MYTRLAYREQKHQLRSVDIDRRICISSINHHHHFFCDLLSNISGKFQSISLCRSSLTLLYVIHPKSICLFVILQLRLLIASDELRRSSFKRDQKAFQLVLAMNISYLFCWSPYAVVCFLRVFVSKR